MNLTWVFIAEWKIRSPVKLFGIFPCKQLSSEWLFSLHLTLKKDSYILDSYILAHWILPPGNDRVR